MTQTNTHIVTEVPTSVDPLLATILCWPRKDLSAAEFAFRTWLDNQLAQHKHARTYGGERGCRIATLARPDGKATTTMFSCHIDTVDFSGCELVDGKVQQKSVVYDDGFGLISLDKANKVGTCLGADDGIGIWLMLKMIEAKVPGTYVFHTGEEVGGLGSREMLSKQREWLEQFEVAIAFDRPRTDEVITHQGGKECASQKCALALCDRLNKHGFFYKPSDRGVFTDTKVYRGVIAECFNIGVGYQSQHGSNEEQDYGHAVQLLDALCKIDFDSLPIDRDPKKPDPAPAYPYGMGGNWAGKGWTSREWGNRKLFADVDGDEEALDIVPPKKPVPPAGPSVKAPTYTPLDSVYDDLMCTKYDDLVSYISDSPESAANDIVYLLAEIGRLRSDVRTLQMLMPEGNV